MFANSNDQPKRRVQFAESDQLSGNELGYDWYHWIDHLISLEPNKAVEELKAEVRELEEELEQFENDCKLKKYIEIDLKFIKCLTEHFYDPEEIVKELTQYIENKPVMLVNMIKSHIVLVKYFAEKTEKEITQETKEFIEGIEITNRKKDSRIRTPLEKNPESVYAILDENTAKKYDKAAYEDKLKELRNLIVDANNNFDSDTYKRLLIRVNNCIVSNSQHCYPHKNNDLIVNPDDIDEDEEEYFGFFNFRVNEKIQEAFDHAKKLSNCIEELLKINHGNFEQILDDIKDLMEPVLKQSDKELSSTVSTPEEDSQNGTQSRTRNCAQPQPEATANPTVSSAGTNDQTQKENDKPQQRIRFASNIPEQGINNGKLPSNPQANLHKSRSKPNAYDNAGMYGAIGISIAGFIAIGVILCATGNSAIGGVFIAGAVISALILGIAKICERVSKEKQNDPKMGTWIALSKVLIPECLSGNVVET